MRKGKDVVLSFRMLTAMSNNKLHPQGIISSEGQMTINDTRRVNYSRRRNNARRANDHK